MFKLLYSISMIYFREENEECIFLMLRFNISFFSITYRTNLEKIHVLQCNKKKI